MSIISERSTSRGRANGFQVTGRGGAGNFRASSKEYERGTVLGPDDYSDPRGRDPIPSTDPYVITSTGRGGAGNIRSASRDGIRVEKGSPETSPLRSELRGRGYDRRLIAAIDDAHDTGVHSFGRGGAGNMSGPNSESSQSRSRSREPVRATGREGFGNVRVGGPTEKVIEELDESERAAQQQHPSSGLRSSGRGGAGNFTDGKVPHGKGARNPHGANHPHAAESFGRGGRVNISREILKE